MEDDGWRIQLASDIQRDGLGVELLDSAGNIVAEVFRCDSDNSVNVTLLGRLPLQTVEYFMRIARDRLGTFEDGSPLPAGTEGSD